jgi:hypothetical protein
MGRVLAMSIGLLVITLLLRASEELPTESELSRPETGLDIVVSARGPLLPPRVLLDRSGLYEAIVAGERILVEEGDAPSGIRAACFGSDLEITDYSNFPLSSSAQATEAFVDWIAARAIPSICILGSSGRIQPLSEEEETRLARVCEQLGAQARPFGSTPASWAYIGVRLASGWVPLAEAYSEKTGVVLLFTVAPQLERYRDHRGEFLVEGSHGPQVVELERELPYAEKQASAVGLSLDGRAGGIRRAGLIFRPQGAQEEAVSVVWKAVRLGTGAYFQTYLGFPGRGPRGSRSATCELRIDDRLIASREVDDTSGWVRWPVDLRSFSNSTVRLELRARTRLASAEGKPAVLWGEPRLHWGGKR